MIVYIYIWSKQYACIWFLDTCNVKIMRIRKFECTVVPKWKRTSLDVPFHFYIHVAHQLACLIPHVLNSTKTDENASSTDFKDKISCLNPLSSEFYHVCYCYHLTMLLLDLETEIFMSELKDLTIFFIQSLP